MRTDFNKLHKQIRKETSDRIFNDLWQQEKAKNYVRRDKYDADIQKKGIDWFNSGLPLEDAPEELRKNTNFIDGFHRGERLAKIAEMQEADKNRGR